MKKFERCEECSCSYPEGSRDYDCIFQSGYCESCIVEKVENGEF